MELHLFKKAVDLQIQNFLDLKTDSLSKYKNEELNSSLLHLKSFLLEGKRIRPYIAHLSYKSSGGKEDEKALKILVFLEIFHDFCLVHDDIMDKADRRHSVKTIHKFVTDQYLKNKFVDPIHFGNSQAILLGDFLFSWAQEILIMNSDFDKKTIYRIYEIFLEMIDDVFLGQMIDLNIATKERVSDSEIMQKMILKTAKYSFIKPLIIGASLATDKVDKSFYESFGKYLGIAFQVQDDLLDIKYDEKQTKKSSFNDIEQHQHTLFTNYVFKNGTSKQKEVLGSLFGKSLQNEDRTKLRKIFNDSGAIKYGEKLIEENLTHAKNLLEKQRMDKKYKDLFKDLIEKFEERSN